MMPLTKDQFIENSYRDRQVLPLRDGDACFVRKGQGPPVLFLHGIPLCLITWRNNIEELSRWLDVILLDLKGFGKSGLGRGSYSPAGHADFVLQLLDVLGLPRVSLVGSSYSCAVAMNLATAHPDRVDRLVLINSVGYPAGPHALERMSRMKVLRGVLGRTLRSRFVGKNVLGRGLRHSFADPAIATPPLVEAYFSILQAGAREETFLQTLEEFDEQAIARLLPSIHHKTLLLWGAKDHVLPVGNSELFRRNLPNARLEIVEDAGHLPHEESPARVNASILRFITEDRSAAENETLASARTAG